jgi:hypothetical protein
MTLSIKTPPALEPIPLSEMKQHLRVDFSDDDATIQGYLRAARLQLERKYNRAMLTQSLLLTLDSFDPTRWTADSFYGISPSTWSLGLGVSWSMIELRPPVQSITSVTYTDPSGTTQTLPSSGYSFEAGSDSATGRIFPALNKIWPAVGLTPGAVKIEWVAGYTTPDLVPEDWRAAVKLFVGHLYENRQAVVAEGRVVAVEIPLGVDALMGGVRPMLR